MKQTIEKNLTDAIEKMIPEDMYERIEKKLEVSGSVEKNGIITSKNKMHYFRSAKYFIAAACLLFIIGLYGNSYYTNNLVVDSVIDFDINPSIELMVNKKDIVMKASAINGDGFEVLNNMDLEGVDLEIAVNAIIGAMLQKGYLDGAQNYILVSVQNEDNNKAEEIKEAIVNNINATLTGGNLTASVIDQTIEKDEAIEVFAKAYGISVGKSTFIWNLADEDLTLDVEELAKYSISEIMQIINHKVEVEDSIDIDTTPPVDNENTDDIELENNTNLDDADDSDDDDVDDSDKDDDVDDSDDDGVDDSDHDNSNTYQNLGNSDASNDDDDDSDDDSNDDSDDDDSDDDDSDDDDSNDDDSDDDEFE